MNALQASITSKGQVTIPKRIRQLLDIANNSRIEFVINNDGTILLRNKKDILSFAGKYTKRMKGISPLNARAHMEEGYER